MSLFGNQNLLQILLLSLSFSKSKLTFDVIFVYWGDSICLKLMALAMIMRQLKVYCIFLSGVWVENWRLIFPKFGMFLFLSFFSFFFFFFFNKFSSMIFLDDVSLYIGHKKLPKVPNYFFRILCYGFYMYGLVILSNSLLSRVFSVVKIYM